MKADAGYIAAAALFALLAAPVFGQAGQGDGSRTGDGSTPFTGLAQAPEANPFVGAAQTTIPILLPPGRKLTPNLSLEYSSNGGPSPYGYGWSLPLPSVQRANRNGARTCGADRNDFVLTLPSGNIECTLDTQMTCNARVEESFARIRAVLDGTGNGLTWTVWDKNGVKYVFGGTQASDDDGGTFDKPARVGDHAHNPTGCGYGASWELTSIIDPNGNAAHLRWKLSHHMLYPHLIRYGGSDWDSHRFEASFEWEGRDDQLAVGTTGDPARLDRRLGRINVRHKAGASSWAQVRAYIFHYAPDREGRQTFLEAVHLRGVNDASELTRGDGAAAAAMFMYHESQPGLVAVPQTPTRPDLGSMNNPHALRWTKKEDTNYTTVRDVFDVTGDGIPDLIDATACPWEVYRGTTAGFETSPITWHVPSAILDICSIRRNIEASPSHTRWTTLDLTGDGIPDFVDGRTTPWTVYRGTPNSPSGGWGFGPAETWSGMPANARPQVTVDHQIGNPGSDNDWAGTATRYDLLDMTGDGRPDLVLGAGDDDGGGSSIFDPLTTATWTIYPNTGSGFGPSYSFSAPFKNTSFSSTNGSTYNGLVYGTFDVNGDGLPDGVISQRARNSTYTGSWRVCLNSGRAMDVCANWALPDAMVPGAGLSPMSRLIRATANGQPGDVRRDFVDVNGDGLPDLVDVTGWNTYGVWSVFLNRGDGFEQSPLPWPAPFGRLRDNGTSNNLTLMDSFDVDGDGMIDQVSFAASPYSIYRAAGGAWVANGAGIAAQESGMRVNLLVGSESGTGGATFLSYRPSTQWDNTGGDGISDLPMLLWTVTEVVRDDGLCFGGTCTNPGSAHQVGLRYRYQNGRYDPLNRALRGFQIVTAEEIGDGVLPGQRTITVFSQAPTSAGKAVITSTYDASAATNTLPISATVNTWECASLTNNGAVIACPPIPAGGVWIRLKRARELTFSGFDFNTFKESVTENVSWENCSGNFYGNVTEVSKGIAGGPLLRTKTDYACLTGGETYIVDRPTRVLAMSAAGVPLQETWYSYDATGRGNVIRTEEWLDQSIVDTAEGCTNTPAAGTGTCVKTHTTYDVYGNIKTVIDALGRVTTTDYDATNIYPEYVTQPAVNGQSGYQIQRAYDPGCGVLLSETVPYPSSGTTSSAKTVHQYDAFCRLRKTWRPGESTGGTPFREYTYHLGAPANDTHAAWLTVAVTTSREPNHGAGRRSASVLADGLGRVIQQKWEGEVDGSAAFVATAVTYDALGRPKRQTLPFTWTCSGGGCLLDFNEPSGTVPATAMEYDAAGRLTRQTNPDTTVATWAHTQAWETTHEDECAQAGQTCAGSRTVEKRDALGRTVERWQYDEGGTVQARTRYTYDDLGRLKETEQGDANGWRSETRVVSTWDSLGRLVSRLEPDASSSVPWSYGYDRLGNLRFQNDPKNNQHLEWCYDELGRVKKKFVLTGDTFANQSCAGTATVTYAYNDTAVLGLGQVQQVDDEAGTWQALGFDVLGRVLHEERTLVADSIPTSAETRYQYDATGDHLWKITYPDGEVVSYTYDAAGQVESLSGHEVYVVNMTYDLSGRVRKITHGNTVEDERRYEAAGRRLSRITVTRGAQTPTVHLQYNYASYTARGQLKQLTDVTPSKPAAIDNGAVYDYDALGRLTAVTNSQVNGTYQPTSLGNLASKDGAAFGYASKPHQPVTYAGQGMSHDGNGSREWVGATGRTFIYDRENRLREIDNGAVEFTYDHTSRRAVMQRSDGTVVRYFSPLFEATSLGTVTKYYTAGGILIAQRDEVNDTFAAADGKDAVRFVGRSVLEPAAVVLLLRRDVQIGLALMMAGGLVLFVIPMRRWRRPAVIGVRVRRRHAAGLSLLVALTTVPWPILLVPARAGGQCGSTPIAVHYHLDRLGSTHVLTAPDGSVLRHNRYTAYGAPRRFTATGAATTLDPRYRYEFTGYETDAYSGLQYAGARFYDPQLGMFQTHDPAREFASPYTYTNWDPVNLTDPTGACVFLGVECAILGYVAAAGAAIGATTAGIQAAVAGASVGDIFKAAAIGGAIGGVTAVIGFTVVQPVLQAGIAAIFQASVEVAKKASIGVLIAAGVGQASYSLSQGDYVGGGIGIALAAASLLGLATQGASGLSTADQLNFAHQEFGLNYGGTFEFYEVSILPGFGDQDAAAGAALRKANPRSISDNREYGGFIYEEDGAYHYTAAQRGTATGFKPSSASHLVPGHSTIVGDYHTHGDYSQMIGGKVIRTSPAFDGFNSDFFSVQDLRGIAADSAGASAYRGYLGTPSGVFRAYNPSSGNIYTIK